MRDCGVPYIGKMGELSPVGGSDLLEARQQGGVGPSSLLPNSWSGTPALTPLPISLLGLDSGFCTISRVPRAEKPRDRDRDSSFPSEPELHRSDSLLSFRLDLDLGPSLLSELLGVMSLSEASAAETPASAPAANPSIPAANPPTPASSPPPRGRCPNGVTAGVGPVAEARANLVGECPHAPADMAPGRHWGTGWGGSRGSRHYTEMDARRELVKVLPQGRASWESLDEEWEAPQAGSRAPVPSTVQTNTFEFADAEEDDEVKV